MKPESLQTMRPLSPRFASLEKSLSQNKSLSAESPKYDGETKTSPRILSKIEENSVQHFKPQNKDYLTAPVLNNLSLRHSPLPFLHVVAEESSNEEPEGDWTSKDSTPVSTPENYSISTEDSNTSSRSPVYKARRALPNNFSPVNKGFRRPLPIMSFATEKTPDSDSLIVSRPLLEELEEAGYADGDHDRGFFGRIADDRSIISDDSEMLRGRREQGKKRIEKKEGAVKNERKFEKAANNKTREQPRHASPSRIPRLAVKSAGVSSKKNIEGESPENISQNVARSSEKENLKKILEREVITDKDLNENITSLGDALGKDPGQQQTTASNMERKLLSSLPKKLKEEAVFKTFATNLKLASNVSRSAIPKRQPLEGRQSVDSGRESYVDEEKPRLYRFDSSSSVSSVGSTRSVTRGHMNQGIKTWSLAMVADSIKKRRQKAATFGKRSLNELDTLKEKLEQAQAKSNSLEAELEPLREKLKRYEVIIENLEDKVEESKQEMLVKERDQLAKLDQSERAHSKILQDERIEREETESELKNRVRQCEAEVKLYKKQVDELEDNLAMLKEGNDVDEENSPMAKQLASLRKELVQVREVLATSEKERLNERKEKLSALQNMIKLTKTKSDIEEELDERKKADTKESSEKYMQLSGKLAVSEMKLQKLRTEMSTEIEQLQKKHLQTTRDISAEHEKTLASLRKQNELLRTQLKDLEDQHRPSSPGRALPYHGKWSAMRSESRKHTTEMKEIISVLEKEGLGPEQCSSEEVVRVLFTRQKELGEKLKEADDVLSSCKNGDPRPTIQGLKDERKILKRQVDDLKQNVSTLESQLKLTEMTSKRQMEDLLIEKKNSFLEFQKAIDDCDAAKSAADKAQKDLVDTRSMLNKRQTELQMLRDNLMSVTNEMKTVDADLGKNKKDLSIKTAELERMKRDIALETEKIQQERKNSSRLTSDVENKKKIIKESEKLIAELESKVQRLTENLEASQMHVNRATSERDSLKEELQSLRGTMITNEADLKQFNSVVANLRNQIKSLEYALKEKVDKLAATSNELEKAKADSLGANHLLGIEEDKNKELEDEVDDLTYRLAGKTDEVERLMERVKVLEDDLEHAKSTLGTMQLDFAETETSLKSHESSRTMLTKEFNLLQMEHREVTREKQRISEIHEETKRTLQQKTERLTVLDKELMECKQQLKEKSRKLQEAESERDRLQEELTYQIKQSELLNENLDTSKTGNRKQMTEIEVLKSQLSEISKRRSELTDELKRTKQDYESKKEKDNERITSIQNDNDQLRAEIKAAQEMIRKQLSALNGYTDFVDDDNERNIKESVNRIFKRLNKSEEDCQAYKGETEQYKSKVASLNSEIERMTSLMSNEKISLTNELNRMKEDINHELEMEKRKHNEDVKQANLRSERQKKEIQKLSANFEEAEKRTAQMEQLINEKESQLRMISREKEQLLDSVEFLQQEIKNTDSNLLGKEKELQKIKLEKELQVSSLSSKQEQILEELKVANEKLTEKENDQTMNKSQVDELVQSLKKENEEIMAEKLTTEQDVSRLEQQLKQKDEEKKNMSKRHQDEVKKLENEINGLQEAVEQQENALERVNRELEKKNKENAKLTKRVRELIEESENIGGEETCQIAQVQQVESAGMGFEAIESQETVEKLEKEKSEIYKRLEEATKELERQQKASQVKRQFYQQAEKESQRLKQEVEYERREKLEALGCLKALIVDNEAMAKCVTGLQDTVALQRQENTDTRRHLKEVLDKYEHQREVSFRTQKTFEDLMESKLSRDQQETSKVQSDYGMLRGDYEELKRERDKMKTQLEHKDKELERIRTEIGELKHLMETKVINFEVEKRARELLESKMHQFSNDRATSQKRLMSMEDSNKQLQGRLIELQKWHNNLEVSLMNGSPKSPLSLKELYEDQARRDSFLKEQVASLAEKYEKLGSERRFPVDKNVYYSPEGR